MSTKAYRDDELLRRWISGTITAPEEAELERRATQDEGLRDALAGLQQAPATDHHARVTAMVGRARPAAVVRRIPLARYAAAATVLVLLAVAALLLPRYLGEGEAVVAMTEVAAAEDPPEYRAPVPASPAPAPRRPDEGVETAAAELEAAVPEPEEAAGQDLPATTAQQDAPMAFRREVTPPPPELAAPPPPPPPVLRKSRMIVPTVRPFTGRVTDDDGTPLAGAEVRRVGQALGVETDSSGTFTLPYDQTLTQLVVTREGYEVETVEVFDTSSTLQISLNEVPKREARQLWMENAARTRLNLDPVVPPRAQARPGEGYRELRDRIEADRPGGLPAGKVRVSFLVGTDGSLSDFRFRGNPDQATMDYVGTTLVESSSWEVVQGEAPVRVYFNLRFE